jgi:hypothetical protein
MAVAFSIAAKVGTFVKKLLIKCLLGLGKSLAEETAYFLIFRYRNRFAMFRS